MGRSQKKIILQGFLNYLLNVFIDGNICHNMKKKKKMASLVQTIYLLGLSSVSDNKVLSMLLTLESQMEVLSANIDSTIDSEVKFMAAASDLADRELVMTISWAKQVPGEFLNVFVCFYLKLDSVNILTKALLFL